MAHRAAGPSGHGAARLDQVRAARDAAQAQTAAVRPARGHDLGARTDAIAAAGQAAQAEGRLGEARRSWASSPCRPRRSAGREISPARQWAAANAPILALLPDLRSSSFVPEAEMAHTGRAGRCGSRDGAPQARPDHGQRPARVHRRSRTQSSRDRLVYRVEARRQRRDLNPGCRWM
jgi:hypothetical protein